MIKSGRFGSVKWNAAGSGSPLEDLISLNSWKLSIKTDYEDVSCFGDENRVYVPGLRDLSGTLGGFWNSDNLLIIAATEATEPGFLELGPNTTDLVGSPGAPAVFSGLAYMDADIDCSLAAPKLTSSFRAAGSWTLPT